MVLLPVETDAPDVALFVKPVDVTVAVLPLMALAQVLRNTNEADLRVLVKVHVVSASGMVMLPDVAVAVVVGAVLQL